MDWNALAIKTQTSLFTLFVTGVFGVVLDVNLPLSIVWWKVALIEISESGETRFTHFWHLTSITFYILSSGFNNTSQTNVFNLFRSRLFNPEFCMERFVCVCVSANFQSNEKSVCPASKVNSVRFRCDARDTFPHEREVIKIVLNWKKVDARFNICVHSVTFRKNQFLQITSL